MGGISVLFLMSILSFIFAMFLAIFLAIIIYKIAVYFFESVSIMCMCKNLKYKAPFAAWIPFYNKYLLGKIAGNKVLGTILALLNGLIVCSLIGSYTQTQYSTVTFVIFLICSLVSFLFDIIIAHKIYTKSKIKYSDLLTVFSVISIGILRPIFLFMIRNKINIEVK